MRSIIYGRRMVLGPPGQTCDDTCRPCHCFDPARRPTEWFALLNDQSPSAVVSIRKGSSVVCGPQYVSVRTITPVRWALVPFSNLLGLMLFIRLDKCRKDQLRGHRPAIKRTDHWVSQ